MVQSVPVWPLPAGTEAYDHITRAITLAGTGGVVTFAPGTYRVSTMLRPLAGQVWMMHGAILERGGTDRLIQADTIAGWAVQGGTFVGRASAGLPKCTALISVESGSERVRFTGSTFKDTAVVTGLDKTADAALRFVDSSWCVADGIHVEDVGYGINIGSNTGSIGTSMGCRVSGMTARRVAANVVFISGSLASTTNPNTISHHIVRGLSAFDWWDTAVELGQGGVGLQAAQVSGDGNGHAQNVAIIRDSTGSVLTDIYGQNMGGSAATGSGYVVRVMPMYAQIGNVALANVTSGGGVTAALRVDADLVKTVTGSRSNINGTQVIAALGATLKGVTG